jgi:hypothetical protein
MLESMTTILSAALLMVWPYGGQRRARANALAGLREIRVTLAEQEEAAAVRHDVTSRLRSVGG